MDMAEVKRRLLGVDDEIHDLLRYTAISKEQRDIEVELENYEAMKETISRNLKQPLDPTAEIGKMRKALSGNPVISVNGQLDVQHLCALALN